MGWHNGTKGRNRPLISLHYLADPPGHPPAAQTSCPRLASSSSAIVLDLSTLSRNLPIILYGASTRLNPLHSASACLIYAQFGATYALRRGSASCLSNSFRNITSILLRLSGFTFLRIDSRR